MSSPAFSARLLAARERDEVAVLWQQLESDGAEPGPFASWTWTRIWLEHFGPVVPHRFVVIRSDERVVGVALLTFDVHHRGPLRFRRVHVGTAGEPTAETVFVERNRLVARPADLRGVGAAVAALLATLPDVDEIALDGFLEADAAALTGSDADWSTEPELCHVVDLAAAGGEDVGALFSRGVRKEVRRAARSMGPLSVEWARTPDRGHEVLTELMDLHQARWTARGRPGAFSSPRSRAFHHALVSDWTTSGRLAVLRVTSAQGLLGARYAFVDGDRLIGYQSGWVVPADRHVSAGLVLQIAVLQEAAQRGYRCWDYLAGTSELKRRLSTGGYELLWATHRRAGLRWLAVDAARSARAWEQRLLHAGRAA